jgi:hypothetical protein
MDVQRSRNLGRDSSFWHVLRIELKRSRGGKVSMEQSYWQKLNQQGYRAVVCWGANQAIDELLSYLEGLYS